MVCQGITMCFHVLAICQSLKLECEHTFTKEVLAPPLDYPSLETSYRWVLSISPGRPKKIMNWHFQWGVKIIFLMKAKHLALLTTLQLYHIPSLPPTSWSYTLYPTKLTHHWEKLQKCNDITDIYMALLLFPQQGCGDSRALHVPGAKQLNPVSQERRRWCAERQVENHGLLLHNGPQLLLEDDEDFQLKHWCSQRSGTRAAWAGKRDGESVKVPD